MAIQVTIIGLRQIGASIGLALAARKEEITRVGNDREPGIARQAEKAGAVDKITYNLPSAVREADVVILAVPFDEVRDTIEVIAQDLKPGAVLIDTSPVKAPVMAWARELLPVPDRYFLSLTPTLNPLYLTEEGDTPHADLFQNSLMLITSLPGTDESALALASSITQILGATPLFSDTVEADGLMAATHLLPELAAAALINTTLDQPGWPEIRKIAGPLYARVTAAALHPEESKALSLMAQGNAANVARLLENLATELLALRDAIADNDLDALQARLEHARAGRDQWQKERFSADWDADARKNVHVPTGGEIVGRLFGIRPKKK